MKIKLDNVTLDTKYFGLYKEKTLFFTIGGPFASEAYIKQGGQLDRNILGRRFDATTGDDAKHYNIGVDNVSPIESESQFIEAYEDTIPAFRALVRFYFHKFEGKSEMEEVKIYQKKYRLCTDSFLPEFYEECEATTEDEMFEILKQLV